MKYQIISAAVAIALISGCSNQAEEHDVAEEKADAALAQSEENKSNLSKGLADVQNSVSKSADNLKSDLDSKLKDQEKAVESKLEEQKAEMNAKLAEQKEELQAEFAKQKDALIAQFSKQTTGVTDQYEGLKSQYQKVKSALSDETVQALESKIPEIDLSLANLTKMVNKFSPETMEQLEGFKEQYASEFDTAQKLIKDGYAAIKSGGLKMPKF